MPRQPRGQSAEGDSASAEPEVTEVFRQKNCRICAHPARTAMEVLALGGDSFAGSARRLSAEFEIEISGKSLKNHMLNHADDQRARQAGLLLAAIGAEDDDAPLLSSRGVISLLLAEALQKVISGEIRVDSAAQLERVLRLQAQLDRDQHQRELDKARLALQTSRAQGADDELAVNVFHQMNIIMTAIRDTVPKEYLRQSILKAWSLGYGQEFESLLEVPFYKREPYEMPDMSAAVEDFKLLGRARTHEELLADGYYDQDRKAHEDNASAVDGSMDDSDTPPDE